MQGDIIRINQIRLSVGASETQLVQKICRRLCLKPDQIRSWRIVRKSIDARKKPQLFEVYTADVEVTEFSRVKRLIDGKNILLIDEPPYALPACKSVSQKTAPVIAGAGPAGLFCAYALTLAGLPAVVVERGKSVEERTADVTNFWQNGVLDPSSNVQFGEGGAGAFSDGKLNTLVKDPRGRNRFVLETFVTFGAPERILYESKPHIGTDILSGVIRGMRVWMQERDTRFLFSRCMTDYEVVGGSVSAVLLDGGERIPTGCLVLAVGHSARDTFRMLYEKGQLKMTAKAFAVGLRVEHPQRELDLLQYGEWYAGKLPAASYKVTAKVSGALSQRGVYSFCMCPGGYVVNASSEPGRLAVNGMSYSGRNGANANSAVIVSVTPEDFSGEDALAGVRFQERLEERAFLLGNGRIPQQLFGDFCAGRPSTSYGAFVSATKGDSVLTNLRGLLPHALEEAFIAGMHRFARPLPGFDRGDAILSGVESRTSSPVRIARDEQLQASVKGIYPCGEGAGYAGGIMSAAMDGLRVAEAILQTQ